MGMRIREQVDAINAWWASLDPGARVAFYWVAAIMLVGDLVLALSLWWWV